MKRLRYQRPALGIGLIMAVAIGTVVPNHHHIEDFRKACELENMNRKQAP
jgi:hypothetical protein